MLQCVLSFLTSEQRATVFAVQSTLTGVTPLHCAVMSNDLKTTKYILQSLRSECRCFTVLKVTDNRGNTALNLISTPKLMHCVSSYVGADLFCQLLSIKNDNKQTPPHTAVLSENMKLLKELLNLTSNKHLVNILNHRDSWNRSALDKAGLEIIQLIVTSISKKNAFALLKDKDCQGDTFVHKLVMWDCSSEFFEITLTPLGVDEQLELLQMATI